MFDGLHNLLDNALPVAKQGERGAVGAVCLKQHVFLSISLELIYSLYVDDVMIAGRDNILYQLLPLAYFLYTLLFTLCIVNTISGTESVKVIIW